MLDGLIQEGYCDLASGKALPLVEAYEANARIAHRYERQREAIEEHRRTHG